MQMHHPFWAPDSDQAEFLALVDGREATVHMELVEYVLNVIAYRGWADAQVRGNLRRAPALGEQRQHLLFPVC